MPSMEELRKKYETVVGLEVHAQLKTKSKIFAPDATDFGNEQNTQISAITLGMPGVLPVLNKAVVDMGILTGLALNCEIAEKCKFDRKQYFYADLPKGYQISQYDEPICVNGYIDIKGKRIGITRAHLEEDAGKLVHIGNSSYVDFNREQYINFLNLLLLHLNIPSICRHPNSCRKSFQRKILLKVTLKTE